MTLPTYSTGTASVAAGGTVVTGSGGMWSGSNVKQGDFISIGTDAVLITGVTDATHLTISPWPYAAKTTQPYVIYQNYVGRVVGVAAAEDVGVMLEKLHTDGLPFIVDPAATVPDPSYGDDGQFAFQPSTGKWWTKTGGAWVLSPGLTSDSTKVLKAGDTMTGNLSIGPKADPAVVISKIAGATACSYYGFTGASTRWQLAVGDASVESGSNLGSDFSIYRFNDAGTFLGHPFLIHRNNGLVELENDLIWAGIPWTGYTPTLSIPSGNGTAAGYYKRLGKSLAIKVQVAVTAGAAAGIVNVGMPAGITGATNGIPGFLVGRENASTGFIWVGFLPTSSGTITLYRYDNNSFVSAGWLLQLSGIVEIQ